jgi:hypothetical protein
VRIFRKIFTEDPLLQRIQDAIAASFQQFEKLPQLDSVIIKDITLASGIDNQVEHKLSRPIQGWQIIRKDANANVWESTTVNTTPSATIILRTSATVKVTILFF